MTKPLPPKSLVLYADDDPDDRDLLAEAFNEYSSDVELITFENGIDLLSFISHDPQELPPCLIILDINMPGINGKQVLKSIRGNSNFVDIPVVLFSTSTLPSEAAFAQSYNAAFITKPLHVTQIHQIVDKMIEYCTGDLKERLKLRNRK